MGRAKKTTEDQPKKRAAIYCRKSVKQRDEQGRSVEVSESIDLQLERGRDFAKGRGWSVVRTQYVDDGISGKDAINRPGFQKLLKDARAGRFDVVIVYKHDRFARRMVDFWLHYEELERLGIELVSISQEQIDTTTSLGRLQLQILSVFAEFERELAVERTTDSIERRRKLGKYHGKKPPEGYRVNDDGKLEPDTVSAPAIRWLFKRYATGDVSHRSLVKELNASKYKRSDGKPWSVGQLCQLLKNEHYLGHIIDVNNGHKILAENAHDPLVSQETFDAVQSRLGTRRKTHNKSKTYLFSGKLKCAICGAGLTGTPHYGSKYYRCSAKMHDAGCCPSGWFSELEILRDFQAHLKVLSYDLDARDLLLRMSDHQEAERLELRPADEVRADLAKAKRKRTNLIDRLADFDAGTGAAIERQIKQLGATIATLEEELDHIDSFEVEVIHEQQELMSHHEIIRAFVQGDRPREWMRDRIGEILELGYVCDRPRPRGVRTFIEQVFSEDSMQTPEEANEIGQWHCRWTIDEVWQEEVDRVHHLRTSAQQNNKRMHGWVPMVRWQFKHQSAFVGVLSVGLLPTGSKIQ